MLALGGWEMGSEPFSQLVSTETNMATFAANTIKVSKDLFNNSILIVLSFYAHTTGTKLKLTEPDQYHTAAVVVLGCAL